MRTLLLVLSLAAVVVAGCTPDATPATGDPEPDAAEGITEAPVGEQAEAGDWHAEVRQAYLAECLATSGDARGYCGCTLAGLEERFSQADFERFDEQVRAGGQLPPAFEVVIDECLVEHLDDLLGEAMGEGRWAQTARAEFLSACLQTSGGLVAYCECALDGMEEIYSQSEFARVSMAIERGEDVPDEFEAVVQACLADHGEV